MEQPSEYRPVSPLAVAALILGCWSAVALFTRFVWFLPLVGCVTAVAAVADVSRPDSPRVGRLPALAGLALSLGFGAQAVSDAVVERWIGRTRAIATADAWIAAIREDRIDDALAVSDDRILPARGEGPAGDMPADRSAAFRQLPAVRAVTELQATVLSAAPLGTDDNAWIVRVAAGGGKTVLLIATPRKKALRQGVVERWTVASAALES